MGKRPVFQATEGNWLDRAKGILVVVGTVFLLELSRRTGFSAPNPQLFTALAITYAAYRGGYTGGLVGAAVGVGYALYFFSSPEGLFHYTPTNLAKVVVNCITLPAIAILVSRLKYRLAASIRGQNERFIQGANAPILGLDRKGRIVFWNKRLEAVTGWQESALKYKGLDELLVEKNQSAMIEQALETVLGGADTSSLEIAISGKDDNPIQLLVSFSPRFDGQDNIVGAIGVGQDITQRKTAERALKESESKLREILENSPVGVAIVSHDLDGTQLAGQRLFINSALIQMFGASSREDFVNARIEDSWVDLEQLRSVEEIFKGRGELTDFEAQRRRVDGTKWWVSMNTRPIHFDGQDCTMVWHFDITERKQIELDLRDSEEKLREAQKIGKIGHWRWRSDTREIEWSDQTYRILGHETERFVPSLDHIKAAIHPDDLQDITKSVEGGLSNANGLSVDFRIVLPDGTTKWVHTESQAVLNAKGAPLEMSGIVQDVTERTKAEDSLRQAQKMEAVGQLTGGVAHDFNNLLAIIQGNAELIAERGGPDLPLTQSITRASARGAELTQRLLAFSRKQPLLPQAIDLGNLVRSMSDLLTRTLGATIEIEMEIEPGLWSALADPGQVENALLNLALNACDAMPDGGKLTIECRNASIDESYSTQNPEVLPGDYVALSVADSGIGMSPDVQAHVFEPFFTTKPVGKGSGLGLSMIYGFAKQSGGHISICSEAGHGTKVEIFLPRSEQASQSADAEVEDAVPRGRGEVILVLEDDQDVRGLVVRMLTKLGYRVLDAADAASAHQIMAGPEPVDLLLSDVVLPGGVSGPEFAKKACAHFPELKVIFISGYPATVSKNEDFLTSGKRLLTKPFERQRLAKAMREVLD